MKKEASHKISELVLYAFLLACFLALIVLSFLQLVVGNSTPGAHQTFLNVFVAGVAMAIFGLYTISRAGFTLSENGLSIARPFGRHWISYQSITRVERVRRKGSKRGEKVRLSFMHSGSESAVEITPANATLLMHDILRHCPHISRTRSQTTKRDRTFRGAKESMLPPLRKAPPVEY